ncbi:MAG: OsmC family protein [Planctomycetes bacterium]|nr:OsmC family protein [Planctomycetota bacterium]
MTADELRALQAPVKAKYKEDPAAARRILSATGRLQGENLICRVETDHGAIDSGLHPAAGGDGMSSCSGDILLQSLVACAGVTLQAVATAMAIPLRGGTVTAEGDLDFRGTLGVSKETPIGFHAIRLKFQLDSDATPDQLASLLKLTERYCVILQTLKNPPAISAEIA